MSDDLRLWVVDSSALIEVRRAGLSAKRQRTVFDKLSALAGAGQLIFPHQVLEELERGEPDQPNDPALAWARRVRERAERQANLETVKAVLARAPTLIDADSTRDPADPYVIALAIDTPALGGVTILANDTSDRRDGRGGFQKLSIATVAGVWDIQVVPLAGFLLRFPELA